MKHHLLNTNRVFWKRVLSNAHIFKQLFIGNNKVVMFDDSRKVYFLGESKRLIHANPNVNKWTKTQTMFICFFFPSYPIQLFSQDLSPSFTLYILFNPFTIFFTTLSSLTHKRVFSSSASSHSLHTESFNLFLFALYFI